MKKLNIIEKIEDWLINSRFVKLAIIAGLLGILVILLIKPAEAVNVYDITAFYRLDESNFCAYTTDEDGGEMMLVFPIEKTAIFPNNEYPEHIEITAKTNIYVDNIISVKAYISQTLDEVEQIK
jgi:hypothetical protein